MEHSLNVFANICIIEIVFFLNTSKKSLHNLMRTLYQRVYRRYFCTCQHVKWAWFDKAFGIKHHLTLALEGPPTTDNLVKIGIPLGVTFSSCLCFWCMSRESKTFTRPHRHMVLLHRSSIVTSSSLKRPPSYLSALPHDNLRHMRSDGRLPVSPCFLKTRWISHFKCISSH